MKPNVFLLVLLLAPFQFSAQDSLEYKFEEVVEIEGISKEYLFLRGKSWFVSTFRDANSVIQEENRTDGIILGKGSFKYEPTIFQSAPLVKGYVNFSISVYFKDGRYKYKLYNFVHESSSNSPNKYDFGLITNDKDCPYSPSLIKSFNNKYWVDIKIQCNEYAKTMITKLKDEMSNVSEIEDSNSGW